MNVWGQTWDWTTRINYHRVLIQAVLIQIGSTVSGMPNAMGFSLCEEKGSGKI